jgi:hypothetical protein
VAYAKIALKELIPAIAQSFGKKNAFSRTTTKDEDDYAGAFFVLSSCTIKAHEP